MKKLEKNGYIEIKREEPFRIRGRKKKIYGLTFRGLIAAIRQKESWEHIDDIANRQKALLPLLFGKWRYFKENVGKEKLTKPLPWIFTMALGALLWDPKEQELAKLVMEGLGSHILSVSVGHEERINWLKSIYGDSELKEWFLEEKDRYDALADLWDLSFSLIRKPTPDWNKALQELRKRVPIHVSLTA